MRIHALSRDKGGCHFYRIRVPLMQLRKRGHDTSWSTRIDLHTINRDSVVIGQFLNGPEDLLFWEWLAGLDKARPLMVYEVDDDLFTMDGVVTEEVTAGKPLLWKEQETQQRVRRFVELADLVTVTTPALADVYRPYARRVVVLPNALPDWVLDLPVTQPDRFTVGWTLSRSHLLDAREHIDALDRAMRKCPSAMFHWVGVDPAMSPFTGREKVTRWVGNTNEYLRQLAGMFTVGIAPLAPYVFNRGKSGLKAQEYAAVGIPAVVSDWPQYADVVNHGATGFLVTTPEEWAVRLRQLYRNPELVVEMGTAAREVESTRTISHTAHRWITAYEEAFNVR